MSAGLELATLRYNSTLPEHSWLRQIMDMFDVEVMKDKKKKKNLLEFNSI